ncbi:hypothetical protein [Microbacterium luticocti]|uniref:hypothetical protein n=1 Tax=Microbacterium luticocti TaxID=451764 RepID=UPI000429861C|nr:hypothetical protein [Microbacterium luticocti]
MSQAVASFDPSPLTEPVDKRAARAFWNRVRPAGADVPKILGAVLLAVFAVFFVITAGQVFGAFFRAGGSVGGGFGAVLFGAVVVAGAIGIVRGFFGAGDAVRAYRLDRFARANGMSYTPGVDEPALPGMIFTQGHSRRSSDLVRGQRPRFVEFGNYVYKTGSGRNEVTHRWGYVAVKLDVPLPNIVLDAVGNNTLFGSDLPASFARNQRLHLEGDFDEHFALYCPTGYERDALYLFTPDIMARFIDHAAALDVEIVDDWLFLYAPRPLSTIDPATWAWLFATVGAILDKLAQWGRWRDGHSATDATTSAGAMRPGNGGTDAAGPADAAASVPAGSAPVPRSPHPGAAALPFAAPGHARTPPPGVAPEGRRLRRTAPVVGLVVVGVFVVIWLWGTFGSFFSAMLH